MKYWIITLWIISIELYAQSNTLQLAKIACDHDEAWGCSTLAQHYEKTKHSVQGWQKTLYFYEKACHSHHGLGRGKSCFHLAELYRHADRVEQNLSKSLKLYEKTCNIGLQKGCTHAGILHEEGQGVEKSLHKAKQFYRKGCGSEAVKIRLSKEYIAPDSEACYRLGKFYEYGINVKQDRQEAARLYKVACKRDFLQGCSDLKKLIGSNEL